MLMFIGISGGKTKAIQSYLKNRAFKQELKWPIETNRFPHRWKRNPHIGRRKPFPLPRKVPRRKKDDHWMIERSRFGL